MDRHPFDPVSFVVGLVFTLAAVVVLAGGRLIDEGRVLLPLGLVAVGFALLVRLAPGRPDATASGEPAASGHPTAPRTGATPAEPTAPREPAASGEPRRPPGSDEAHLPDERGSRP